MLLQPSFGWSVVRISKGVEKMSKSWMNVETRQNFPSDCATGCHDKWIKANETSFRGKHIFRLSTRSESARRLCHSCCENYENMGVGNGKG